MAQASEHPANEATLAERASDLGYAAGWMAVRALPDQVARGLFNAGADVAWRRMDDNAQLRANLARVLGVRPAAVPEWLIRESMRSYARYWREAFRLPTMDRKALVDNITENIVGREKLDAALAKGNGLIFALPHSANWDLAGLWLTTHYGGFATVAERLKPESLYQRFVDYRESLGFTVLPLTGGQTASFPELKKVLADNGIVCLMGERDLRRTGVEVDFFGARTRMPAGPVKLAQETGATLMYAELFYSDDTYMRIVANDPIDVSGTVEEGTQLLADDFAAGIARHPQDWHMLQPLWLEDLDADRQAFLAGSEGVGRSGDRT